MIFQSVYTNVLRANEITLITQTLFLPFISFLLSSYHHPLSLHFFHSHTLKRPRVYLSHIVSASRVAYIYRPPGASRDSNVLFVVSFFGDRWARQLSSIFITMGFRSWQRRRLSGFRFLKSRMGSIAMLVGELDMDAVDIFSFIENSMQCWESHFLIE